jgi:hypothetical protein
MRMLVDIPDASLDVLNAMAQEKGAPLAELVGNAVAEYVRVHGKKRTGEGIAKSAGLWGKDFEDGLAYQERLRAEWDDR